MMYMDMQDELEWFASRGHWVIRRVPNTKDEYYIACGYPPYGILRIYRIKK